MPQEFGPKLSGEPLAFEPFLIRLELLIFPDPNQLAAV